MDTKKTNYKEFIVSHFDSYYYKKLKKSLPEKIRNGEIEWIYSYGGKLVARGHKSVFEAVKRIVETKDCKNPYIDEAEMYERCLGIYETHKNKKFWIPWFK